MKKRLFKTFCIVFVLILTLLLCCCEKSEKQAQIGKDYSTFEYTHYASGGTEDKYNAVILFEHYNPTFTQYQVAYSSCTCRPVEENLYMVCYVEILNKKGNLKDKDDIACIRNISCLDNLGMWGDSNPNYYIPEYTQEYMNENLTKAFIGLSKRNIDQFKGYNQWIEELDVDALAGATVSSSNMQSMLKSLMNYHVNKYL